MSLRFTCNNCGQTITVKFLKVGEMARCKNCDNQMQVPDDALNIGESSSDKSTADSVSEKQDHLSSVGLGKVLIPLLWIGLVLSLVLFALAFHLKDSMSPLTHSTTGWTLIASILLLGPVYIVQVIVFLLWLARVHIDLERLYPGYPITPGKAVVRLLIPVYHVWGVWNVFSTLSSAMKPGDQKIRNRSAELSGWLVPLVLAFVFNYVVLVEMIAGFFGSSQTLAYESMFSDWDVISFAVGVVLAIIYLRVAVLVRKMLRLKHSA